MLELVLGPIKIFFSIFLVAVLIITGGVLYKDHEIDTITTQEARLNAVYPNGTDPTSGTVVNEDLANRIKKIVPVSNVDLTGTYNRSTIPPNTLSVSVDFNDGNLVTTKVYYGWAFPMPNLLKKLGFDPTGKVIPLTSGHSYWREWQP